MPSKAVLDRVTQSRPALEAPRRTAAIWMQQQQTSNHEKQQQKKPLVCDVGAHKLHFESNFAVAVDFDSLTSFAAVTLSPKS